MSTSCVITAQQKHICPTLDNIQVGSWFGYVTFLHSGPSSAPGWSFLSSASSLAANSACLLRLINREHEFGRILGAILKMKNRNFEALVIHPRSLPLDLHHHNHLHGTGFPRMAEPAGIFPSGVTMLIEPSHFAKGIGGGVYHNSSCNIGRPPQLEIIRLRLKQIKTGL
jgi:hypothetical protein